MSHENLGSFARMTMALRYPTEIDPRGVLSAGEYDELCELQSRAAEASGIAEKILLVSEAFLGRPYKHGPLKGSAEVPEEFVVSLREFDCVTFCETVLAIARSADPAGFCTMLREIRYEHGMIEWQDRNHYSIDWIHRNVRKNFVEEVPVVTEKALVVRELCALEDYPPKQVELHFLPVEEIACGGVHLRSGDLIYFGTTREDLDVLHLGFCVIGDEILLRHASKAKGKVLDEPLDQFLERYGECPGVLLARPCEAETP